jgi:hypothetical protein
LLGGALALALAGTPARAQDSQCAQCHQAEAALERDRAHQRAGIACVDCHGGDPGAAAAAAAKAAGTGYRVLGRETWPELCGSCHADVRRMNPYGIPTDQLARYRTSRHGEAFFASGDQHVATCVECHGSHGILGPRSSESPVHPTKVPATCGKCHSDPELVDEYGLEGDEQQAYEESVHAALLKAGDLSAPQCATCHGNHGAVPPGFDAVTSVCGKCHVRQQELFSTTVHARLTEKGEFKACASCHGHHRVLEAGEHILEQTCTLCHAKGDRGMAVRDALLGALRSAESRFAQSEAELDRALHGGFAAEDDRVLLEEARTALVEMQALQHGLDVEALGEKGADVNAVLDRLHERVAAAQELERTKRFALLPVVGFFALMSFGFWVRFRRIHAAAEVTR